MDEMRGLARCCFFLSLLMLTAASVLPLQTKEESDQRDRRAPRQCFLSDGRTMESGANFTRLETGPCVFYRCRDGNVFPLEYKCLRVNKCYPLGHIYRVGCIERTCQFFNGVFEFVISREACLGRDLSTCVDVGSTHRQGCFEYSCEKHQVSRMSVSYTLRPTEFGCEMNGRCLSVNQTVTQGCRTIQCQQHLNSVGFHIIADGCEINGRCVNVGDTLVDDCHTFACSAENLTGLKVLNIRPVHIQCKDADNNCHESGEYFPISINNMRVNCTCQVEGLRVQYSCPPIG